MSKDISRLIFTMIGALVGLAVGLYGLLATFKYYDEMISRGGILPVLVVVLFCGVLFCGGGLVGGGYALLSLHVWRENVAQRKKEASKKKYGRKKR